jgi:MinD superfamily P-loop ATPase
MIKELAVISGKGGTGKTSIVAALSCLSGSRVMADCDVDAADLHLVLKEKIIESGEFQGGKKAFIREDLCNGCGNCASVCEFEAINSFPVFNIDKLSCEGCGVCVRFCPRGAVTMKDHVSGKWFVSETAHGPMVRARLGIAEGNSGKLVTMLRNRAKALAKESGLDLVIIDGSPGTGCPVIAGITGASLALVVTEPTVSGLHDLKRVHELTSHFRIRTLVCVNRADINPDKTREINDYCVDKRLRLLAEIPYDEDIVRAQMAGISVVEYSRGPAAMAIEGLWEKLQKELQ